MRILSLLIIFVSLFLAGLRTDSPHGPAFKVSCSTCHSSKGWQLDKSIYSFDHNKTKLPLVGQHTQIDCRKCHISLVFSEAKKECSQCHVDIHQNTVGMNCSRCHTPKSWLVNNINEIHQSSRFPLLGAHKTADCYQCHKSESLARFDVIGINCIDCHRSNYMGTTNPNHTSAGYSQDCSGCHPMNAFTWNGAGFNHSFFSLKLGHSNLLCADCHKTPNYKDTSPLCYSCHQAKYLATTNPPHQTANFPTTCETCHSLNPGWTGASYNHTNFPLTQGHATPKCEDCHKGNYTNTPTDCYACHSAKYNATTNPVHSTLGFPTTCELCHTTVAWTPASYKQHDSQYFPIYSGRHNGTWTSCTECHPNASNYKQFTCISCHAHSNKSSVDSHHQGVHNYTYTATSCFDCHPKGNAGK
jgi:hypothetical protein